MMGGVFFVTQINQFDKYSKLINFNQMAFRNTLRYMKAEGKSQFQDYKRVSKRLLTITELFENLSGDDIQHDQQ